VKKFVLAPSKIKYLGLSKTHTRVCIKTVSFQLKDMLSQHCENPKDENAWEGFKRSSELFTCRPRSDFYVPIHT
jgi:hypothetical protein